MKKTQLAALALVSLAAVGAANAQWIQNGTAGPSDYNNPANWEGGVINNLFTNNPVDGLEITFGQDTALSSTLTMAWPGKQNVTFRSDSATPRTITLNGGFVKTNNTGGIITVGTAANPLVLDLNGATRQLGGQSQLGSGDGTNYIFAKVVDSSGKTNGVNVSGSRIYTYLMNDENSFVGPVSFVALRGGGFSSIKNIGAGPSAMGAPTDVASGTVSIADNSSFGSLSYYGSGDTTDRTFLWNNTSVAQAFSFENRGTGKITFTGPWRLNPTRSNSLAINAINAPIELGGYISGPTNTLLLRSSGANTNRVILSGKTNTFFSLEITNVIAVVTEFTDAGLPSSMGTNAVITHWGNGGTSSTANRSGQGAVLEYVGQSVSHDRAIKLTGSGFNWGIANATTSNSVLTFRSDFIGGSLAGGTQPRYLHTAVYSSAAIELLGVIPDVGPTLATTVVVGSPYGQTIFNGGTVSLLNPANTFGGGVQVKYARTLNAATLADTGVACSIGTATLMPNGTSGINWPITLGSTDSGRGGNIAYVGNTAASCNRDIGLVASSSGSPGFGIYNNSPNNSPLDLTGNISIFDDGSHSPTNVFLRLGGTAVATNTLTAALPNTVSGFANLAVIGSIWRVTGNHSYAGSTAVGPGTLLLEGSVGGSGVNVGTNGVLAGTGTAGSDIVIAEGGTLAPGAFGIGTLTGMGNVTNFGTISMEVNKALGTKDQLVCSGVLALGGQLSLANVQGNVAENDSFKLFQAGSIVGQFDSVTPVSPGPGLLWDISSVPVDGTVKVIAGSTEPPQISSVSFTGGNMVVSGTGGNAGGTYYVVSSADVAAPVGTWTPMQTNTFAAGGAFSFEIPVSTATPKAFFRVQVP